MLYQQCTYHLSQSSEGVYKVCIRGSRYSNHPLLNPHKREQHRVHQLTSHDHEALMTI